MASLSQLGQLSVKMLKNEASKYGLCWGRKLTPAFSVSSIIEELDI